MLSISLTELLGSGWLLSAWRRRFFEWTPMLRTFFDINTLSISIYRVFWEYPEILSLEFDILPGKGQADLYGGAFAGVSYFRNALNQIK